MRESLTGKGKSMSVCSAGTFEANKGGKFLFCPLSFNGVCLVGIHYHFIYLTIYSLSCISFHLVIPAVISELVL